MEDFKNERGVWSKGITENGIRLRTRASVYWYNVKYRCTPMGNHQNNNPTYEGCFMSDDFKNFQRFADWCQKQVGYNTKNYHIDKDLLIPNNKKYSEDTCVFIPAALNTFFVASKTYKGSYPQGVKLYEKTGKFVARINIENKLKHLGYYETPEQASEVYISAKEEEAKRWAQRLINGEFAVDKRVIDRMLSWRLYES